jgi:hypothetical protein
MHDKTFPTVVCAFYAHHEESNQLPTEEIDSFTIFSDSTGAPE